MLSVKRRKEITDQICEYPCKIDFGVLDIEEKTFAINAVISAKMKKSFKVGHFTTEQEAFLNKGKVMIENAIYKMSSTK